MAGRAKQPERRGRGERFFSAARRNLEKAWAANRGRRTTPAQLAASRRTIKKAQSALRGRPRKLSPAQLAAARANVARARAALARRGRTPEHLAKLRETIKLARAGRTPESVRLQAAKVLKHGMFARSVRRTMRALGQNEGELDRRVRLLRRYFGCESPEEDRVIRALADALWRRERLYTAQAVWESEAIDRLLAEAEGETSADLSMRAYDLSDVLADNLKFYRRDRHLIGSIERLLRRLMRLRYGKAFQFQTSSRVVI